MREQLGVSHRHQKDVYDRSASAVQLRVGDKVWLYTPAIKKGRTAKFSRPWSGPWQISKVLNGVTYKIARMGFLDAGERRNQVVHRNRLKPYLTPVVGPPPPLAQVPQQHPPSTVQVDDSSTGTELSAEEGDEEEPPPPVTRRTIRRRRRPAWHAGYL